MLIRRNFKNREVLQNAVLTSLTSSIFESLVHSKIFHLALTGGGLGGDIARDLACRINQDPEDFRGLHIWWSDERFVPHDSKESNTFAFLSELSEDVEIHIHRPLPSDSNIDVDICARRYAADIYGVAMDLTLLGVGEDGHVASLFPDMWDSKAESSVIAVHNAPKNPPQRITFSLAKINESARVWLLASGAEKALIVKRLLNKDSALPATYVEGTRETLLLTDITHE